jgi:lipopolysaccharide biosynthesis glycosyltransferase
MEILCACDETYVPHTATMLYSLLKHNASVRVHLFHSSIALRTLKKLNSFVLRHGGTLVCYQMIPGEFEDFRVDGWASIANYYRLSAPRVIPKDIHKILYLDSDLMVRQSLNDLWNTDLTGHGLAAVTDLGEKLRAEELGLPVGSKYFNSGVLLVNLEFWRQHDAYKKLITFIRKSPEQLKYWDQDALNVTFANRWIELPLRWNVQHDVDNDYGIPAPAIAHFCGEIKPWHRATYRIEREYRKYRGKTPWPRYKPNRRDPFSHRVKYLLRSGVYMVLPFRVIRQLHRVSRAFKR